jgi:hypothetical protein
MHVILQDFKGKIHDRSPSGNLTREVFIIRLIVFDVTN